MDRCDVLIVGGGPAGSSCATVLARAGLDVVVMDKAAFPRDKVCAGWITPAVVEALELDIDDYQRRLVFQTFDRFRVGLLDGPLIESGHQQAVSYGIRRCEFDNYLLQRSGARLRLGETIEHIVRTNNGWMVNEAIRSPVLIGAGGHFCPVARHLGAAVGSGETTVTAQEAEFELPESALTACATEARIPELFFCPDLKGYGWCVRKGNYLNIGLGREGSDHLSREVADFGREMVRRGRMPDGLKPQFKGHAYLLYPRSGRRLVDDRVLLIGDAAGLAYSRSGEGIRPAVESGLFAAQTILEAETDYDRDSLNRYVERLDYRLGPRDARDLSVHLPAGFRNQLARRLMQSSWFIHRVVLDRWFLHSHEHAIRLSV